MTEPLIWVLLGERTGDNNQVLALAQALGRPYKTFSLRYNGLRAATVWLGPTAITLDRASRSSFQPPWPDLVISIGRRSVPVSRWIRKQSGGRTRIVLVGNPRVDPAIFDLVITTRQYPVPASTNVLLLPVAMSHYTAPPEPTPDEVEWIAGLPRPVRLMAIGGATKYWTLSPPMIADAVARLRAKGDGSLIIVTSRRTDPEIVRAVEHDVAGAPNERLVAGSFPRFAWLLGVADEVHVTADSVSMLSEAILAGKPVGLIPIEQDRKGRRYLGPQPQHVGRDARRRDLRRFWLFLEDQKAIGTIDEPSVGKIDNPNAIAAEAVNALLDPGS